MLNSADHLGRAAAKFFGVSPVTPSPERENVDGGDGDEDVEAAPTTTAAGGGGDNGVFVQQQPPAPANIVDEEHLKWQQRRFRHLKRQYGIRPDTVAAEIGPKIG